MVGLSDQDYAIRVGVRGAAIGGHVRHLLDHYLCLLRGLECGEVDYEGRERDPQVESSRAYALSVTRTVQGTLRVLAERPMDTPLAVRLRAGALAEQDLGTAASCLGRELQFVLLHTVHHLALIAIEMRSRGLPCEPQLGVAPGTLGSWTASA